MSKVLDRIEQLQEAHPWMLEREARGLLVAMYAALQHLGAGDNIQAEMDDCVQRVCDDDRKGVERALSNLPPKLLQPLDDL